MPLLLIFKKKALPLHSEKKKQQVHRQSGDGRFQVKRDCYRIICETEVRNTTAPQKTEKGKRIMMTTVMALAVVALMIAKAINVNNHIEMGK